MNGHDLPNGEVITFYSYKGGTGRSMLLANVAWQLASLGKKVLIIDWDLEAPGLHRYFRPFLESDPEMEQTPGVMDWVSDYWDAALQSETNDVKQLVLDAADPRRYVVRLQTDGYLFKGGIDLMGPGRQTKSYAADVANFDWIKLFTEVQGEEFILAAKAILVGPGGYDYVLVDSRTGVSDTAGICTVLFADTLVVCFTYNNQSIVGASNIARNALRQAGSLRSARDPMSTEQCAVFQRRYRVYAVPSRYDETDPERLEQRQTYAWARFAEVLTDVSDKQAEKYWVDVHIRHQSHFAYEEVLAVCVNRPGDSGSLLGSVANLVRELTNGSSGEPLALTDNQRKELRDSFARISASEPPLRIRSAWELVLERAPIDLEREKLFNESLSLLTQLFSISSQVEDTTNTSVATIVRNPVLETELTLEERRMAESLIWYGVVCRRISESGQSVLDVVDDSILSSWSLLRNHVEQNRAAIALRDRVRAARRVWDTSGRRLESLADIQLEELTLAIADEQKSWLGKPNLQFVEAVVSAQTVRKQIKRLEDTVEAQLQQRREDSDANQSRLDSLTSEKANELNIRLAAERKRESASSHRTIYSALAAIGATAAVGVGFYINVSNQILAEIKNNKEQLEQQHQRSERALVERENVAKLTARREFEKEQQAQSNALAAYKSGTEFRRNKRYVEAIGEFDKALGAYSEFPDAYFERARARGSLRIRTPKDKTASIKLELEDYASFYDLSPSLSGRSNLILKSLSDPSVDITFIKGQLTSLLRDAKTDASTQSLSTKDVAMRLENAANEISNSASNGRGKQSIDELVRSAVETAQELRKLEQVKDALNPLPQLKPSASQSNRSVLKGGYSSSVSNAPPLPPPREASIDLAPKEVTETKSAIDNSAATQSSIKPERKIDRPPVFRP